MSDLATLERKIDRLTKSVERLNQQQELLNEDEAAKFLGLTKRDFRIYSMPARSLLTCTNLASTARGCITKTNSHYE